MSEARPWNSPDTYEDLKSLRQRVAELESQLRDSEAADRHRTEEALRLSDLRYRMLFHATQDGILIVNEEGRYVDVNESYARLLKASRERLIGTHFGEFIPVGREAEATAAFASLRMGGSTPVDFPLRATDGSIVELEWSSVSHYVPGLHFCTCRDVTQRKRAETLLRESEERLRLAQQAARIGTWSLDLQDPARNYWSQEAYEIAGLPATWHPDYAEWLGYLHPDDRARVDQVITTALQNGGMQFAVPYRFMGLDGVERWQEARGQVRRDMNGVPLGAYGITIDVSEEKRIEQELRQTAERLTLSLAAAHMGDWSWYPATDVITLSERAAEIFNILPGPRMTRTQLREMLSPEDKERARLAAEESVRSRTDYDIEYRVATPDGGWCWVYAQGRPTYDEAGHLTGMLGVLQDVTERKRAEEERLALLKREQEARRTAELLNGIGPLLLAELDFQKLVQHVTDLATQLVGAEFGSFFHNVTNDKGGSYMLYTLSGAPREAFAHLPMPRNTEVFGPTFRGERVVRSSDITKDSRYGRMAPHHGMPKGHLPVRSYLAASVVSRSGEVFGGLFFGHSECDRFSEAHEQLLTGIAAQAAIAFDNARLFTASEQAQAALEASNQGLRLANDDLEQFAFAAAHDLQEPLRMVTSYTQLLARHLGRDLDEQSRVFMEQVVNGAKRMVLLLQDLLAYLEASREADVPPQPVDLGQVLQQCVGNLATMIEESHAEITAEPLPWVLGWKTQYVQLLQNLLSNSIKYCKPGTTPRITITAQRYGTDWQIAVADNGIGIEPAYHRQVFGVFKRLHGKEIPGTGIGLAICQRVIDRAGGRIWLESEPGMGTTFHFTLPATEA